MISSRGFFRGRDESFGFICSSRRGGWAILVSARLQPGSLGNPSVRDAQVGSADWSPRTGSGASRTAARERAVLGIRADWPGVVSPRWTAAARLVLACSGGGGRPSGFAASRGSTPRAAGRGPFVAEFELEGSFVATSSGRVGVVAGSTERCWRWWARAASAGQQSVAPVGSPRVSPGRAGPGPAEPAGERNGVRGAFRQSLPVPGPTGRLPSMKRCPMPSIRSLVSASFAVVLACGCGEGTESLEEPELIELHLEPAGRSSNFSFPEIESGVVQVGQRAGNDFAIYPALGLKISFQVPASCQTGLLDDECHTDLGLDGAQILGSGRVDVGYVLGVGVQTIENLTATFELVDAQLVAEGLDGSFSELACGSEELCLELSIAATGKTCTDLVIRPRQGCE